MFGTAAVLRLVQLSEVLSEIQQARLTGLWLDFGDMRFYIGISDPRDGKSCQEHPRSSQLRHTESTSRRILRSSISFPSLITCHTFSRAQDKSEADLGSYLYRLCLGDPPQRGPLADVQRLQHVVLAVVVTSSSSAHLYARWLWRDQSIPTYREIVVVVVPQMRGKPAHAGHRAIPFTYADSRHSL